MQETKKGGKQMSNLIKKELTLDSREVARMVEKNHAHLLRDIETYKGYLGESKIGFTDFFIPSTYISSQNKELPGYQITKKGCEFIAHKLTGQKGALFTAAYINRFHELEGQAKQQILPTDLSPELQVLINMELKQRQIEQKTEVLEHRINSLDATNINGTPRQRLNDMVRKYAYDNGILYPQAWKDFRRNFNTAYRTNIELKKKNYQKEHGIKDLTYPEYMERIGLIEDALRVADKMLNQAI